VSAPPAAEPWATRPLRDLLDVVASRSAPVGGGSAAAVAAAVAAALVERCATEAGNEGSRGRAEAARGTLTDLVDIDAAALVALVQARAQHTDNETTALIAEAASAPVARLRGIARELASLAEQLERTGKASLRSEARCAHLLADAAARAADAIIAMNDRLMRSDPAPAGEGGAVVAVDLAHVGEGSGPRWGMQSEELNATLLAWPAGHEIAEHLNTERDVLMVVLEGSVRVSVDDVGHLLAADQLLLIPRGSARAMSAGPRGVRYLVTHRRRGPLLPTARATR
jgi:formiminotetrahydrofolate cyclodeaminase/quercetin dioxygenase-like cupin family protein